MDSKRILILGGGRYNVPSILAARRAGFFTVVADKNPDAPGLKAADLALPIDLNDCDSLIEAVKQNCEVAGVVSMAEVGVRPAAHISAQMGLPHISEEAAGNSTSKAAMRRLWRSIPEYSIDFEVAANLSDAEAAVEKLATFPLIFKPDRSLGGSRGVTRVESSQEVIQAFHDAKNGGLRGSDVVIEHCIDGTEHSAEVLIWNGRTSVLCIGQKVKSVPPYRVDVSVQYPAPLAASQRHTVEEMCDRAVRALRLAQGVAHVEFCYTPDGPVLFEIGARCGGGHTPQIAHHVCGVNEFVEACRMACGMAPTQFTPLHDRGADYRFLIFDPGVVESIDIPETLSTSSSVIDVGITVQLGHRIAPLRSTSDRSGFLVVTGENLEEAAAFADKSCRRISLQYSDGSVHHAMDLTAFQELAHS
jgi:biotin carboxylase